MAQPQPNIVDRIGQITEAKWSAAVGMEWLVLFTRTHTNASKRKARLYGCACCRRIWDDIPEPWRAVVEILERFGDRQTTRTKVREVVSAAGSPQGHGAMAADWVARTVYFIGKMHDPGFQVAQLVADRAVPDRTANNEKWVEAWEAEKAMQCHFARDIFGNPFRPVSFATEWRTDTTVPLARQMYDSRDFTAMPILADALQDAGCENESILDHCRGPGPHVRGCWVVDLVLGKK